MAWEAAWTAASDVADDQKDGAIAVASSMEQMILAQPAHDLPAAALKLRITLRMVGVQEDPGWEPEDDEIWAAVADVQRLLERAI